MKITSLNVISFGKLKNLTLNFKDTNLIVGENESGKSTLSAFISFMLFGGDRSTKNYIPWDGEYMEGSLEFTLDSRTYSVYRRSGGTAKTKRLNIICLDTGEQLKEMPFKGYLSLFSKTAFIPQQASVFSGGNDLSSAVRQAVFGENEDKVHAALAALGERRKLISNPRGKSMGELDAERQRLSELLSKQSQSAEIQSRLPYLSEQQSNAQLEYDNAAKELSSFSTSDISALEKSKELIRQSYTAENEKLQSAKAELELSKKASKLHPCVFYLIPVFALLTVLSLFTAIFFKNYFFATIGMVTLVGLIISAVGKRKFSKLNIYSAKAAKEIISSQNIYEENLQEITQNLNKLRTEYTAVCRDIENHGGFSDQNAKHKLDAAAARLYSLKEEISRAKEASPKAFNKEIEEAKKNCSLLEEKLINIQRAEEGIKSALENLNSGLLPRLSKIVSKTASMIMGREVTAIIDSDFNLSLAEISPHSSRLYSGGTQDQLYLALRLAAAEIIFGDDAPPLIFDDPFIQYDLARTEKALDILLNLPKSNQIIIFSCKNSPVFENKGFNILTM